MVRVHVIAEGQTEEAFINRVVAPSLYPAGIYLYPTTLSTSKHAKGGAVSFERFLFHAKNLLKQEQDTYLTTFLDLYGLDTDFPNHTQSQQCSDIYARAQCLEQALQASVIAEVACRPERFFVHIQPYEYEGLLFSDVHALAAVEPKWQEHAEKLSQVRNAFETPEHINDSYETKPSRRLEELLKPKYRKTTHGPLAAKEIGLSVIEQACPHFKKWMDHLRSFT